jgi:hypothetical protein
LLVDCPDTEYLLALQQGLLGFTRARKADRARVVYAPLAHMEGSDRSSCKAGIDKSLVTLNAKAARASPLEAQIAER